MKLKTGIQGFDEFLQGGLPPRVLLLMGPPGSGNEVFARQIAHSRAKEKGVTYFTVTKSLESVKNSMAIYRWDVSALEQTGNWRFINLNEADSLTDAVTKEMKQSRCLVIDSLSELLLNHKVEEITNLLDLTSTQNRECQELQLVLLTEGMQDPKVERTMQHFAEGVIIFTARWEAEILARNILIEKMEGSFVPSRRLAYSIGEKGFNIETAIRIT